jgi:hypothetical protein
MVLFLMAICELIVHMGALDTVFIAVSVHISEMEWFRTVQIEFFIGLSHM